MTELRKGGHAWLAAARLKKVQKGYIRDGWGPQISYATADILARHTSIVVRPSVMSERTIPLSIPFTLTVPQIRVAIEMAMKVLASCS